jgi:hypothetical protein
VAPVAEAVPSFVIEPLSVTSAIGPLAVVVVPEQVTADPLVVHAAAAGAAEAARAAKPSAHPMTARVGRVAPDGAGNRKASDESATVKVGAPIGWIGA